MDGEDLEEIYQQIDCTANSNIVTKVLKEGNKQGNGNNGRMMVANNQLAHLAASSNFGGSCSSMDASSVSNPNSPLLGSDKSPMIRRRGNGGGLKKHPANNTSRATFSQAKPGGLKGPSNLVRPTMAEPEEVAQRHPFYQQEPYISPFHLETLELVALQKIQPHGNDNLGGGPPLAIASGCTEAGAAAGGGDPKNRTGNARDEPSRIKIDCQKEGSSHRDLAADVQVELTQATLQLIRKGNYFLLLAIFKAFFWLPYQNGYFSYHI